MSYKYFYNTHTFKPYHDDAFFIYLNYTFMKYTITTLVLSILFFSTLSLWVSADTETEDGDTEIESMDTEDGNDEDRDMETESMNTQDDDMDTETTTTTSSTTSTSQAAPQGRMFDTGPVF